MTGVLLDEVDERPAQTWRPSVGPFDGHQSIETARGEFFSDQLPRPIDVVLPQFVEDVGRVPGTQCPVRAGIVVPINSVEWWRQISTEESHREVVVLDEGEMFEESSQRNVRSANGHP